MIQSSRDSRHWVALRRMSANAVRDIFAGGGIGNSRPNDDSGTRTRGRALLTRSETPPAWAASVARQERCCALSPPPSVWVNTAMRRARHERQPPQRSWARKVFSMWWGSPGYGARRRHRAAWRSAPRPDSDLVMLPPAPDRIPALLSEPARIRLPDRPWG